MPCFKCRLIVTLFPISVVCHSRSAISEQLTFGRFCFWCCCHFTAGSLAIHFKEFHSSVHSAPTQLLKIEFFYVPGRKEVKSPAIWRKKPFLMITIFLNVQTHDPSARRQAFRRVIAGYLLMTLSRWVRAGGTSPRHNG